MIKETCLDLKSSSSPSEYNFSGEYNLSKGREKNLLKMLLLNFYFVTYNLIIFIAI
jgi:hypothetical protein